MNDDIIARTPLRCSPISDLITTRNGEVTEERTIRLENETLSITLKGQPGTLPFIEGEEYSVEFRTLPEPCPWSMGQKPRASRGK